jgi:hypothetical protein
LNDIVSNADQDLRDFLLERRNLRAIPHRLEHCGYVPVHNDSRPKDGLWWVGGRRQRVYAKAELSKRDQRAAVHELVRLWGDAERDEGNDGNGSNGLRFSAQSDPPRKDKEYEQVGERAREKRTGLQEESQTVATVAHVTRVNTSAAATRRRRREVEWLRREHAKLIADDVFYRRKSKTPRGD